MSLLSGDSPFADEPTTRSREPVGPSAGEQFINAWEASKFGSNVPMSNTPVRVRVRVLGDKLTKPHILHKLVAPAREAKTIGQLLEGLETTQAGMESRIASTAKVVNVRVGERKVVAQDDVGLGVGYNWEEAGPGAGWVFEGTEVYSQSVEVADVDVDLKLSQQRLNVEATWEEGEVTMRAGRSNLLGRAYSLFLEGTGVWSGEWSFGKKTDETTTTTKLENKMRTKYSFVLQDQVPRVGSLLEFRASRRSSSTELHDLKSQVGEEISCTWKGGFPGRHEHEVTCGWDRRSVGVPTGASIPATMEADVGTFVKAFIRHRIAGRVDNFTTFTNTLEVSGVTRTIRNILRVDWMLPLSPFTAFGLNFKFGAGSGFGGDRLPIYDRFFLGNSFVRGYKCIGPATTALPPINSFAGIRKYNFTGGNVVAAASANFYWTPPQFPLRSHAFFNLGNCDFTPNVVSALTSEAWVRKFVTNMKASFGVGLSFPIGNTGNLEVNFALPVDLNTVNVIDKPNGNLFTRFRVGLCWTIFAQQDEQY